MTIKEVKIGRSIDCDIPLDACCKYASGHHGSIYIDGNQLMFRDNSTNGTLINNVMIKGRAIPINPGDNIVLAGHYPLSWNQIGSFFPVNDSGGGNRIGQDSRISSSSGINVNVVNSLVNDSFQVKGVDPPLVDKWSWGAFCLSPIWGFFNGCWWAFFIAIFTSLLSFVPYMYLVSIIIDFSISIMFGVCGRRWAWENRSWSSIESFNEAQHSWDVAGLILFILGIFLTVFSFIVVGAAIFSILIP